MPAGTEPGPGGPEQWGPRESSRCHLCATVPSRRPLPASAVPQPDRILLVLHARRRTHQRLLGLPSDPRLHRSDRVLNYTLCCFQNSLTHSNCDVFIVCKKHSIRLVRFVCINGRPVEVFQWLMLIFREQVS